MSTGRPHARTAVSLLLAGSGVALIAAARERWWPACPFAGFDSADCLAVQDDSYGSLASPWLQGGHTGELQAVAIALMGLAILFLPLLWVRRPVAVIALSSGALTVASLVVAGSVYYESVNNGPVDFTGLQAAELVWWLGLPLYLMLALTGTLAAPYVGTWPRGTGWRLTFLAVLLLANPVLQFFVAPIFVAYSSYDATPWADAISGGLLLCAALAVWPASSPRPEHSVEGASVTGRARTTQPTLPGRTDYLRA